MLTCLHSSSGNIFIDDWDNNLIRKVTIATGIITTFAGGNGGSYGGDNGAATSASLYQPYGLGVDSLGKTRLQISPYFVI